MRTREVVLAALATSRLTRLITEDEITAPVRGSIEQWSEGAQYGSLRERLAYIPTCRSCTSVYAAAAVVGLGLLGRGGRAAVGVLAISEAALATSGALDIATAATDRLAGRAG